MTDDQPGVPQVRPGPIAWLQPTTRHAVERVVSRDQGYDWRIAAEWDYSEFACHRCAIVSDGSFAVFFKFGGEGNSDRQFDVELATLKLLKERAGVLVPRPIAVAKVPHGTVLIMEAVRAAKRGTKEWGDIGLSLARIHRVKGQQFGFASDGFWGPLHQDNTLGDDWPTFFGGCRLMPLLMAAHPVGTSPRGDHPQSRETAAETAGVVRSRHRAGCCLHGDAQQNNFISAAEGANVIDPASFYGHPEWDLALCRRLAAGAGCCV